MKIWIVKSPVLHCLPIFKLSKPTHEEIEAEYGHRILSTYSVEGPFDVWISPMLESIDYELLRMQKQSLFCAAGALMHNKELVDHLYGIVGLIDAVQDEMSKYFGVELVFGTNLEENPTQISKQAKRPTRKLNIKL